MKQKKCRFCKKSYDPFSTTQKVCSINCAIQLDVLQKQKQLDEEHKERKREFKKNDKTAQKKSAQTAFNAYIRYRDRGEPCISCGKPSNSGVQFAAGHYFTVGARPDIRFNEDNCHKQCNRYCNSGLSGNVANYKPRIIDKIGIDRFQRLEKVKIRRYTAEDYLLIAKEYREKLKKLKDENE